jgi:hypothetical protein
MNSTKHNTLAAAVSTKRIGIVVFNDEELIYFAVKTLKSPRTSYSVKRQISLIVREFINEYKPDFLVIKTLGKQQMKSKKQLLAVRQVKSSAEAFGIPWTEISLEQIKPLLSAHRKPNKTNAFRTLSEIYPELKRFVESQNLSQAEYYNSLLSAATVGFYFQCRRQMSEKENPTVS